MFYKAIDGDIVRTVIYRALYVGLHFDKILVSFIISYTFHVFYTFVLYL